ncbi:MAG: NUDIX domain-containing protein [Candidatus Gracilibacteria bacterium]|nr:NUDIX domain-containing protein [Candidatus Gracilibacteria bacterium]
MENSVRVGIGVFVIKDDKILLGYRTNTHGGGNWGLTGGHLEFMESFEDCAIRETLEETNIKIKDVKVLGITNDFFTDKNKHYVSIFLKGNYESGDLKIMEPDKFEKWEWFSLDNLPQPLWFPIENFFKQGIKVI